MTTETISRAVLMGDARVKLEERFERLLESNIGALGRLVASYAKTPGDSDDLMQEIAIALWRALPGFRGESSERTFLFRIAHNRCFTYLSRHRQHVALDDMQDQLEDTSADTERDFDREQSRERLLAAVTELPPIYREIVILALEGFDYGEISEVTGISESNVGVRLSRARHKLRKELERRK